MASTNKTMNEIVSFIMVNSKVHYHQLIEYTGLSRKTIVKYLDQIQKKCSSFGVELVRKRNVGIYFKGNVSKLKESFQISLNEADSCSREMQILDFLLKNKKTILLDDLADKFFISRSTLIRELNKLKESFGIKISSNVKGIFLDGDNKSNNDLTARVIKSFWVTTVNQRKHDEKFTRNFNIPPALTKYIQESNVRKMQLILAEFIKKANLNINEYEYESLLIHSIVAVQRIKDGETINDNPLIDRKVEVILETTQLVKLLEKNFNCKIPENEIKYLNIHIIAIKGSELSAGNISQPSDKLTNFLKEELSSYDELLIKNLVIHLLPAIKRCKLDIYIKNPYTKQIKLKFPLAIDEASRLAVSLQKEYQVMFNEDEICYIALHFESYIERESKNNQKIKIAIVCSTGYGTAVLLKQQIIEHFGRKLSLELLSVQKLIENGIEADIILSTIPLSTSKIKVLQVPPFLNDKNLEIIKNSIDEIEKRKYLDNFFIKMINPNCIIIENEKIDRQQAIVSLTDRLYHQGFVTSNMQKSAIERERLSSTSLGIIAIPHGNIKEVIHPVIGVLSTPKGIIWSNDEVKLCFFVALDKTVSNNLDNIYSYFYDLIRSKEGIKRLIRSRTSSELYENIRKEMN
ncbi:BglG family transcription antiterminator [Liquorilactobacillus sicerae]|uniref:BglG family transcription antiterminator n=1 Tax=Liquorilactobacillus sicerae TaxID=1416943 RepID=UPI0024807D9D|nr:PRD domain-containing protein [Liquorilactobacillus sicerae]